MFRYDRVAGFTLLELIFTVVILAIAASFAIPSFQGTILNSRLTAQVNETSSLISYARSEASKSRSGVVTVCGSTDSANCSGNAAWETGWIVFRDIDGDRSLEAADGDQLLKVRGILSGGNSLRIIDLSSDSGNWAQFASNGFLVPSVSGNADGTFVICDDRGATNARAIAINVSGQTRLAGDNAGTAGILDDHNGNDISCP